MTPVAGHHNHEQPGYENHMLGREEAIVYQAVVVGLRVQIETAHDQAFQHYRASNLTIYLLPVARSLPYLAPANQLALLLLPYTHS